jgi:hypothetical protein
MDYAKECSTLSGLSRFESGSFVEIKDDDQRLNIIRNLEDSPTVAFAARSVIFKSVILRSTHPKSKAKKRKRLEDRPCAEAWLSLGFKWALSDAASREGLSEWITICIQILKHQRSEAHPERASGAEAVSDEFEDANTVHVSHVAAVCVRCTLQHLPTLWDRYHSLHSNSGAADECDRLLQAILSLILGCVKQLLQNDVPLELHSLESNLNEDECISNVSKWPSIACLHLPSIHYLCVDPVVSLESKLRAFDMLRKILQKPHALGKPIDYCTELLVNLDDPAVTALDDIDSYNSTPESNFARCNFIDDRKLQSQVAQRVLLLWSKALRSTIAVTDSDRTLVDTLKDAKEWRALGSSGFGRKGAARLIVEGLADDDQWLIEALLDITFAAQSLVSQSSTFKAENPLLLHTSAYNVFLRGPDSPLHPFSLFAEFCNALRFDERIILDLLISSETKALEYLLRVLRLKHGTPLGCPVQVADESKEGKALALLVRLREAVTRANAHHIFPYNPRALLSRFDQFFS